MKTSLYSSCPLNSGPCRDTFQELQEEPVDELRIILIGTVSGVGNDDVAAVRITRCPARHGCFEIAEMVELAAYEQKGAGNPIVGFVVQAAGRGI